MRCSACGGGIVGARDTIAEISCGITLPTTERRGATEHVSAAYRKKCEGGRGRNGDQKRGIDKGTKVKTRRTSRQRLVGTAAEKTIPMP